MKKRIALSFLLLAFVVSEVEAQNRTHRRRGVILGGLAGAAVGAAIGDKGDNETAGALIGGAVGAIAGGAYGNQKDLRLEQQRAHAYHNHQYQQQLQYQQQQNFHAQQHLQSQQRTQLQWRGGQPTPAAAPLVRGLTTDDIVLLTRRGVGDKTIIEYLKINGVHQKISVQDIIHLHESGVSEQVIIAMQTAPLATADGAVLIDSSTLAPASPRSYRVPTESTHEFGSSIVVPPEPRPATRVDGDLEWELVPPVPQQ